MSMLMTPERTEVSAEVSAEVLLGSVDQIPMGEGRVFPVRGVEIAVFHTRAGAVYAAQAECPHRQGPLADGIIGGTIVMCPFHSRKFDLTTGVGTAGRLRHPGLPDPADGRRGDVVDGVKINRNRHFQCRFPFLTQTPSPCHNELTPLMRTP